MRAIVSIFVGVIITASFANAYTRSELERLSKDTLIEIILDLQSGGQNGGQHGGQPRPGGKQCKTYLPAKGEKGSILNPLNNPGYVNHGTLRYPDGKTFMHRNSGYVDDFTFFYPDGSKLLLKNNGYVNHNTIYWPGAKVLRIKNSGYVNDGSISHFDGSEWLVRNSGYVNDRQRNGLPVETVKQNGYTVTARLTEKDSVDVVVQLRDRDWSVDIQVNGETNEVSVKECL